MRSRPANGSVSCGHSRAGAGAGAGTFGVEERDHVTKLLDAAGNVRLICDTLQAAKSPPGEACRNARELMDDAEVGELPAGEAKGGNSLDLIIFLRHGQLEALLREVGAALETDGLFWLRGNIFEDDAKKLIGKIEDTHFMWDHA